MRSHWYFFSSQGSAKQEYSDNLIMVLSLNVFALFLYRILQSGFQHMDNCNTFHTSGNNTQFHHLTKNTDGFRDLVLLNLRIEHLYKSKYQPSEDSTEVNIFQITWSYWRGVSGAWVGVRVYQKRACRTLHEFAGFYPPNTTDLSGSLTPTGVYRLVCTLCRRHRRQRSLPHRLSVTSTAILDKHSILHLGWCSSAGFVPPVASKLGCKRRLS